MFLGLFLALIVPLLTPIVDSIFYGTEQTSARIEWGIVVHWINLAVLIAVVILAERQSLTSIGLRSLRWWTIPLGLLAGVVITALAGVLVRALGVSTDQHLATFLQSLPFSVRLLLVVTAGVFEETLYRGYALERLASAFNSKWVAAAVTVAFFTLGHVPAVGFAHLLPVFIVSVFVTLLYLWRRDLMVNVVAHATIDGIGLLLVPILAHHGAL
ncbi:MAG: CPBP family intramembrane metalloprotease [Alphaproteobacteria bacterium]|nr:CPBP family intramembrane metalloprotease [Alphaproteobacteria bacterium]